MERRQYVGAKPLKRSAKPSRCITERLHRCLIVQEIMLESFALASYSRVEVDRESRRTLCSHRTRKESTRSRFVDSQGEAPWTRSVFDTGLSAASGCDDTSRCWRRNARMYIAKVPRQLREAVTVRSRFQQPSSRSVAASVSEDAGHAGIPGSNTCMGYSLPV